MGLKCFLCQGKLLSSAIFMSRDNQGREVECYGNTKKSSRYVCGVKEISFLSMLQIKSSNRKKNKQIQFLKGFKLHWEPFEKPFFQRIFKKTVAFFVRKKMVLHIWTTASFTSNLTKNHWKSIRLNIVFKILCLHSFLFFYKALQ